MLDPEISTRDALRLLSSPGEVERAAGDHDLGERRRALSRRRFLQLVGMGAGAGLTGAPLIDALGAPLDGFDPSAFAAPVASDEGIIVVLGMYGGNDGANTVVPLTDGHYIDQRGPLAIAPAATLPLDHRLGLHPALGTLHALWGAGQLAVVEGVGYPDPDLSHFTSMAIWMSAIRHGTIHSGWLGRWLDGHLASGPDLYTAASIGSTVPLHVVGRSRRATSVPPRRAGFGGGTNEADQRLYAAVRDLAAPAGQGPWHDALAAALRDQVDLAEQLAPVVPASLPDAPLTASLEVAARLINADLGFRVLETGWGDFDSHAGQASMHPARMVELDAAVARFFEVLDPAWAGRVTVMTFSEFGRTPYSNASGGTDHGTASAMLVFGAHVAGGTYGAHASTAGLQRWERPAHTVDLRSYYASIIDGWLGGGSSEVLGGDFDDLGLFAAAPGTVVEPGGTGPIVAPGGTSGGTGGSTGGSTGDATKGGGSAAPAAVGTAGAFVGMTPVRMADTRDGAGGIPVGTVGPGATLRVPVAGRHGVPPNGVVAVVANVTAVDPSEATYLTVAPGGSGRPDTSNLNPVPGRATPNLVVMGVGADGAVDVFNHSGSTHCIVDVFGYFVAPTKVSTEGPDEQDAVPLPVGQRFTALTPSRVIDTRDGTGARPGPVGRSDRLDVRLAGRAGVPMSGATAVVLNVTVVHPESAGYLAIGPGGAPAPGTSNLNFVAGQTVPNLVIGTLGPDGDVSVTVETDGVHVLADVFGYFATPESGSRSGALLRTVAPARLLDSRDGTGVPAGQLGADHEMVLQVAGRGGVPADAVAVIVNLTATAASHATFVSAWPDGEPRPSTSNLNPAAGSTVANLAIVKVGAGGRIRLVNAVGQVHAIADVFGYFVAG